MISVKQLSGFGEALKELRWNVRMKQIEVCRATGMTAPQVSRYENGHEMPTVESLVRYLIAVKADFCDLQKVLETGQAPARRQPPRDAASDSPGYLEQAREEGDSRLASSSSLKQMVGTLLTLNIDGMERLEHRMKSMEEWQHDLNRAREESKRAGKELELPRKVRSRAGIERDRARDERDRARDEPNRARDEPNRARDEPNRGAKRRRG